MYVIYYQYIFFKEKLATAEEEVKRFNILLQETGTFRQIEEKEFGHRKEKKYNEYAASNIIVYIIRLFTQGDMDLGCTCFLPLNGKCSCYEMIGTRLFQPVYHLSDNSNVSISWKSVRINLIGVKQLLFE